MRIQKFSLAMVKEKQEDYAWCKDQRNTPEKIAALTNQAFCLDESPMEKVVLVGFDCKLKPVGLFLVSKGGQTMTVVDRKMIFQALLLCNANCFAIVHNHPSGSLGPSKEDLAMLEVLREAGEIMDIKLVDSIIVSDEGCYSMELEETYPKTSLAEV